MTTPLISEQDLQAWTGYKHRDALINWLCSHRVPYWLGNQGKICVTEAAINTALLRIDQQPEQNTIEF